MSSPSALLSGQTPLAVRMRPVSLDEVAGQRHLLRAGSPIVALADPEASSPGAVSIILWGPPGTGKTTLAQAIARSSGRRFVELSAITAGVKDVREVMQEAITDDDIGVLVDRAVSDARGLSGTVALSDEARSALIRLASGDARRALTGLEAAAAVALSHAAASEADDDGEDRETAVPEVTADDVAQAVDKALLRYDRQGDEHYDVISAFIKSIRGSDPDAALHYLARMIEAGEDPRFIARRLVISASEDVGLADPQALGIAVAAADAVAFIGMPEGRIPLAEATVYLATTAKSNAAYVGIDAAIADIRAGGFGRVPLHLRDAHYPGAKRLGHGRGYRYAHDSEFGIVPQQYLPDELDGRHYYEPKNLGAERDISARLERIRRILGDR